MPYPYGTQGAPVAGAGAPGLPSRPNSAGGDPSGAPVQYVVLRANAIYFTPDWATYARVTALGKGGQGVGGTNGPAVGANGSPGGGGAGIAATNIETVSAGTPINVAFTAAAALASFLNYQLSGGNGGDGVAATGVGGAGGIGSGGAINFNGAAGQLASGSTAGGGGGAAGRGGNGGAPGSGGSPNGGMGGPGDSYATGGGGGGAGSTSGSTIYAAGLTRSDACLPGAALLGKTVQLSSTITGNSAPSSDGGDAGGGSGGAGAATISNIPGGALVLVELW